jgi:hypothetical protein
MGVEEISAESSFCAAAFEVNLEPHIGARPSARLCVGLIKLLFFYSALPERLLRAYNEQIKILST